MTALKLMNYFGTQNEILMFDLSHPNKSSKSKNFQMTHFP